MCQNHPFGNQPVLQTQRFVDIWASLNLCCLHATFYLGGGGGGNSLPENCTYTCTFELLCLVAPYCAIPRDYLSDTPLLRAMGFLVSQHGQLGAIPPPPFLGVSPLESMRSGGAIPPHQKGYLSDTCAIPYENKANGCDTPLCDTISKRYCAIWGGISHWAAKLLWN